MIPGGSSSKGYSRQSTESKLTIRMIWKDWSNLFPTAIIDSFSVRFRLEDEQMRQMLASPLYIREREENEGQTRANHPERESFVTGFFSGSQKFRGNLMQCFDAKVNLFRTLEKGLLFHQTRSHATVLYDTLPAFCMEIVESMKRKGDQNQKVRLTPRVPRVV